MNWLSSLAGYRTYLASWAKIFSAGSAAIAFIATTYGELDLTNGAIVTAMLIFVSGLCDGLAKIFQRAATASTATDVAALVSAAQLELKTEIAALHELLAKANAAKPVLPVNPVGPINPADPFSDIPTRNDSAPGTSAPGTAATVRSASISGLGLLIVVGLSTSAMASQPVAIINGPRTAEAGEEVVFDASKSEGTPTLYAWRVFPKLDGRKQLTVLEGGAQVRLASFPGRYLVRVMVANAEGISDQEIVITIPGTPPCPPAPEPVPGPAPGPVPAPAPIPIPPTPFPGPNPAPVPVPIPVPPTPPNPPVPAPDLPPGEFDGLPAAIKALALSVVSPTRASEAAKLADAFEAIAAQLAAGTLKTPIAIVAAVGTSFNSSVTSAWDAQFRPAAVNRMRALYEAGKLGTPDRWRAMLLEAATGLRAVK